MRRTDSTMYGSLWRPPEASVRWVYRGQGPPTLVPAFTFPVVDEARAWDPGDVDYARGCARALAARWEKSRTTDGPRIQYLVSPP